jgi:predicted RNase H-like HicB family nuclease
MAENSVQTRYTVIIQWSDEDQCYVVCLPEWGPYAKTHGKTYEEAARNAREVLELLMQDETAPPTPKLFHYPGADISNLPADAVGKRPTTTPAPARKSA